jgi:hypothetical protein
MGKLTFFHKQTHNGGGECWRWGEDGSETEQGKEGNNVRGQINEKHRWNT